MTRKSYLIAGLLSVTAIGGVAAAGQALHSDRGPMRADADRDGVVSRPEFFTAAEQRFAKRDTDGNRVLAGSELGRRGRIARLDGDKSGSVSFAAAAAATSARFARLDADKDGKLTPEEMGPGRRRMGAMGGRGAAWAMMRADADRDGRVTRDEMRAEADRRFDRLDANRDGAIDRSELRAMRGPERGPGRGQDRDGGLPQPADPGEDD